ncbi:hypothetical protein D3C87_168440 [compost metagenome]
MKAGKNTFTRTMSSSLILSLLALAVCGKSTASQAAGLSFGAAPILAQASLGNAYRPPSADQIIQMVAPVALFPDKLLAQVLAAGMYPEQITAADQLLKQNPSLQDAALDNVISRQAWDVSVKSLTAFPAVLSQLAGNIRWTEALGNTYANAPNDVMNAVQTLRLRALQSGKLKSSREQRVTSIPYQPPPPEYADDEAYYVVEPPAQIISIDSAQPDVVYVPEYNPALVYGAPLPVYPSYVYRPGYGSIAGSIISFNIGIIVGSALSHHGDWGWHPWGMNWGGHGPHYGHNQGWRRPAVIYNNSVYAPRSSITINRNYDTRINTRPMTPANRPDHEHGTRPNYGQGNAPRPGQPMTRPHFSPSDTHPGARPPGNAGQNAGQHRPQRPPGNGYQNTRPRSETGERLNSGGRHDASPSTLRSGDVQRSGVNRPPEARHGAPQNSQHTTRQDFRQQPHPAPQMQRQQAPQHMQTERRQAPSQNHSRPPPQERRDNGR